MITGDQIGLTVRFYVTGKGCGWKTGRLLALEKQKKRFIAVIEPPIAGQRKRRVPAEDCEAYFDGRLPVRKTNKKEEA